MRKPLSLLALLFVLFSATCFAQKAAKQPPNYTALKHLFEKQSGVNRYDSLLSRFRVADTSLSIGEYRLLYYGYFFRPDFSEDDGGAAMDSIRALYNRDSLSTGDWRGVAHYARLAIDTAPYSLRAHRALINAHRVLGDSMLYRQYEVRRDGILDAILSTGDGRSDSTAFHVISVSHEYDLLGLFGFQSKGQSLTANLCDYVKLEENKYGLAGLYFDVSQLFEVRQRTWFGKDGPTFPNSPDKKGKSKR